MSTLLEYKCPNCGGQLEFDSSTQQMKCPYCDSEIDIEALKGYEEQLNNTPEDNLEWQTTAGQQWGDGEENNMDVYVCQSCGGEIVGDSTTAATSCPYCDNPVVMAGKLSGTLKPDYVIPFKLDKKAAKEALKKHTGGKRLLPKVFTDENHIDEIKGIYVPFWLFDADADADYTFKTTHIKTWSDSKFRYTETKHYRVSRSGSMSFLQVPVDGSMKMPDDLMESIEPFDFSEAVDFKTAYLSGYLADKYDVNEEQSINRANERITKSTEEVFANTVKGYDSVTIESKSVRLSNSKAKYALYPVWILNTTWKDKKFTFAMNGQTGKLVGDLPVDNGKAKKYFALITAAATAVAYGAWWLLGNVL